MLGLCKHAVSFQKFGNFEPSPIFLSLLTFYQNVFDMFLFYEILDFILKIKVNMCLRVCFIICRDLYYVVFLVMPKILASSLGFLTRSYTTDLLSYRD